MNWPNDADGDVLRRLEEGGFDFDKEVTIDFVGYVQFQIRAMLTYELVANTQELATNQMKQYGGWCESWGVMQE